MPRPSRRRFYGHGIPGVDLNRAGGQIDRRRRARTVRAARRKSRGCVDWLEGCGHATVQVGLKRSTLVSEELDKAQNGKHSEPHDVELFYATDFADQLENIILPALKAGFMVLADRYIYTLMARDMVRGMDEAWLKNLYGIALVPDAVFYLTVAAGGTGAAQLRQKSRRWIIGKAAWTWDCRATCSTAS